MDRLRATICKNSHKTIVHASAASVTLLWDETVDGSKLREFGLDFLHDCIATRTTMYKAHPNNPNPEFKFPRQLPELLANGELSFALRLRFADLGDSELEHPAKTAGCFYHVGCEWQEM